MNLKVYRLREDAKLPLRAHETDAGMDLFYCPNGEKKLYDCSNNYFINPFRRLILVNLMLVNFFTFLVITWPQ